MDEIRKQRFFFLLLVFILNLQNTIPSGLNAPPFMDPTNLLKSPDCRCFVFSSERRLHGSFKSPDNPQHYPADTNCILYIFQGRLDEIVQINFTSLHVNQPLLDICYEFLAVVPHMGQNPSTNPSVANPGKLKMIILCGTLSGLTKSVFYSEGSALAVVFFTSTENINKNLPNPPGFRGKYAFLNASNFRVNGELIGGTDCSYTIQSSRSAGGPFVSGRIISPDFPNDYPSGRRCSYAFVGRPNERVVFNFHLAKLISQVHTFDYDSKHQQSCIYENISLESFDRILVHSIPMDGREEPKLIGRLCGTLQSFQVVTDGPALQITFISLPFSPKGQGFLAEYAFIRRELVTPTPWNPCPTAVAFEQKAMKLSFDEFVDATKLTSAVGQLAMDSRAHGDGTYEKLHENTLNSDPAATQTVCPQQKNSVETVFFSVNNREGDIASPSFPDPYPKCVTAKYYFIAAAGQALTLTLHFLEIGDAKRCEKPDFGGDTLSFYDGPSDNLPPRKVICGSRHSLFTLEARVKQNTMTSLTSTGDRFTVVFVSDEFEGKYEYGFRIRYRFMEISKEQGGSKIPLLPDPYRSSGKGKPAEKFVYFNYHQLKETSNARLTSPSLGGLLGALSMICWQ